jgi:hypothetical protein
VPQPCWARRVIMTEIGSPSLGSPRIHKPR